MEVVTASQMREMDKRTINKVGIPGTVLMERAGLKAFEQIVSAVEERGWRHPFITILVGKGNNGGDGLVVARLLHERGYSLQILLMGPPQDFTGEAAVNWRIVRELNLPAVQLQSSGDLIPYFYKTTLFIDALLGTGLTGPVRGLYQEVILELNQSQTPIISLDIPSGLQADTGEILGCCVAAWRTITFGLPKLGHFLYPGAQSVGELRVVDIGIPKKVIQQEGVKRFLLPGEHPSFSLPQRQRDSHKGRQGHLLLLAGSTGMTGAAVLAAQAALRGGCGLVTLGIPQSLNPILEARLTECMTLPLPEKTPGILGPKALEKIQEILPRVQGMALGPGLGQHPETRELLPEMLKIPLPLVLDADGINLLSHPSSLKDRSAPTILTPHPGELARLLSLSTQEVVARRIPITEDFAASYPVILALKGVPTVVSDGETTWINTTGNPGMATAGSGDVLTGLTASLLVQGLSPLVAASLGVYLHGLAGDLGALKQGEEALLAGDLIQELPQAIKQFRERRPCC